jgi:4-hydroxy-2-oxoheptanedioate aldolase
VQDAERVIEAACFAPLGARSFGAGRRVYGRSADRFAYMRQCNEELSICVMIESRAGLDIAGELAALPGIDYLSYGMLDLAQSLGHPGNSAHPAVVAAARDASARIHAAGKRVREDFMNFAWVNDILIAGARNLLDGADPARAPRAA